MIIRASSAAKMFKKASDTIAHLPEDMLLVVEMNFRNFGCNSPSPYDDIEKEAVMLRKSIMSYEKWMDDCEKLEQVNKTE